MGMFYNKKGEGNSNMILFIATILVAAIAASALMQTAFSLQNKALLSAERSKEQISVATEVVQLYAEDGLATPGKAQQFYMRIRMKSGGNPIKLDDTFLGADFSEGSADLFSNKLDEDERNCTFGAGPDDSGFWTDPTTNQGNYSYVYLVKGNKFKDHYLHDGDVILVCFMAPYAIPEGYPVGIQFLPKPGTATFFETAMPDEIIKKRVYIYP